MKNKNEVHKNGAIYSMEKCIFIYFPGVCVYMCVVSKNCNYNYFSFAMFCLILFRALQSTGKGHAIRNKLTIPSTNVALQTPRASMFKIKQEDQACKLKKKEERRKRLTT